MAQVDINGLVHQLATAMVGNLKKAKENLDEADEAQERRRSKFYSIQLPAKKIDAGSTE